MKLEWFGWSFFRFTSPTGRVLTNPFITGNADAAVQLDDISKADLILVPNGHRDEIGDTVAIAKRTGARTVSPFELGTWFISKGVPEAEVVRRNPGSGFRPTALAPDGPWTPTSRRSTAGPRRDS